MTNSAIQDADNSTNEFNALPHNLGSANEFEPPTPFTGVQSLEAVPDGSKEQASFISNIQRDKDASFAVMSQSNTSMIQNSQYMNASFLMGGLNSSSIKPAGPITPGKGGALQPGPAPLFADLKPRHTGVSKMTAPTEQEVRVDEDTGLNGVAAQQLDSQTLGMMAPPESSHDGQHRL